MTDRGEVVAELAPPGQAAGDGEVPAGLAGLDLLTLDDRIRKAGTRLGLRVRPE